MANGHVEIHDPFKGQNGMARSTETTWKSTSDSESTEGTVEFRILMAYAKRRRRKEPTESSGQDKHTSTHSGNGSNTNGMLPPPTKEITAEEKKEKKKKKKIWKRLPKVLTCLKPQTKEDDSSRECKREAEEDTGEAMFRSAGGARDDDDDDDDDDDLEEVATRLTKISNEIPFVHPEIENDSEDEKYSDDVEKVIGLLLRDAGDRLNERELKDTNIVAELLGNYSFFEKVIDALLTRMGLSTSHPETIGPKVSTKTQIAVTCEATSRLSVLDTMPMNRLLGHGATYLKNHHSSWAEQQGGYENAFDSDDEEVH